jgi:hypothetical protein
MHSLETRETIASCNGVQLRIFYAAIKIAADYNGVAGQRAGGQGIVQQAQMVHALLSRLFIPTPGGVDADAPQAHSWELHAYCTCALGCAACRALASWHDELVGHAHVFAHQHRRACACH